MGRREEHSMSSGGQLGSLKEGRGAKDETYSLIHCPVPIPLIIKTPVIPLGGITLMPKKKGMFFVHAWTVEEVSCVILMTNWNFQISNLLVNAAANALSFQLYYIKQSPHCSNPPKILQENLPTQWIIPHHQHFLHLWVMALIRQSFLSS